MDTKSNENVFKGEEQEASVEYNLAQGQHKQLERGLKSRHIQFLALGMSLSPTKSWFHPSEEYS